MRPRFLWRSSLRKLSSVNIGIYL